MLYLNSKVSNLFLIVYKIMAFKKFMTEKNKKIILENFKYILFLYYIILYYIYINIISILCKLLYHYVKLFYLMHILWMYYISHWSIQYIFEKLCMNKKIAIRYQFLIFYFEVIIIWEKFNIMNDKKSCQELNIK